jgi:hypothetical protein
MRDWTTTALSTTFLVDEIHLHGNIAKPVIFPFSSVMWTIPVVADQSNNA